MLLISHWVLPMKGALLSNDEKKERISNELNVDVLKLASHFEADVQTKIQA